MSKKVASLPSSSIAFRKTKIATAVAIASGLAVPTTVIAADADSSARSIEEIIVTARKRESNIQDTSVSIQAFTQDDIEQLDISRFEDFAEKSASVSYVSAGPGTQLMHIRGVSDGGIPHVFRTNVATATFYLDEQPITGRGGGVPDLHLYDIERIEVLRGPEGTYYGASSVSGTVRIITNKPNPEGYEFGTDISGGAIDDGEAVYTGEAFVNIPLSDSSALRLVGWYDKANGFVDNVPVTRTYRNGVTVDNSEWAGDDYNEEEMSGARLSFLSHLNDQWTLQLSAMTQSMETEGAWDHDPTRYSDLEVARFGPEFTEVDTKQFSLTLEGETGIGDLVYAGSYYEREDFAVNDYSDYVEYASFGNWIQQHACDNFYWYGFSGCADPSIFFESENNSNRESHEIRLSSLADSGSRLNWIIGAYYEKNEGDGYLFWEMPGINFESGPAEYYISGAGATPLPNEWWSCPDFQGENSETAVFGEISYDINDKLNVALGLRSFESKFGAGKGLSCGYPWEPKTYSESSAETYRDESYKVNVSYDINEDLLIYGAFGQGFRRGGDNPDVNHPEVPEIYEPDGIDSYEFGWKATLADGAVFFNGAAYYMDWDNFQTVLYDLLTVPFNFRRNVEGATVTGVELDLLARIGTGWTINGGLTYNQAELVDDFSTIARDPEFVYAEDGRALAHVPEWKATMGVRYDAELSGNRQAYGQLNWTYTDERWNLLARQSEQPPEVMDSYQTVDLRVGMDFGESWGAEVFATNLTDEHAEIFRNSGYYDPRVTTIRPRTFGLRLRFRG